MADDPLQGLVVWTLDTQRCALPVSRVDRVLPALAISPLPDAPAVIAGHAVLHGQVVPVLDLRRCLGLPEREVRLDDSLVLARGIGGALAFFADSVACVMQPTSADAADALMIADPWSFIVLPEQQRLGAALASLAATATAAAAS
jgi:purine-binding chemotaxis protein CheW